MSEDAIEIVAGLGREARAAAERLAVTPGEVKDRALRAAAEAVRDGCSRLLEANARDLEDAAHLRASMVDRLRLDEPRVEAIARGLEERLPAFPIPWGPWPPPGPGRTACASSACARRSAWSGSSTNPGPT